MTDDLDALDPAVRAMSERYQARIADRPAPVAAEPPAALPREAPPPPPVLAEEWGMVYADAELVSSPAFAETEAVSHTRSFLAEAREGQIKIMVLSGAKGAGKTIAGCWAMIAARPELGGRTWSADRHPRMITAVAIARWGQFGHVGDREALAKTKLLVIDDMGLEHHTAKGYMPYLFELLNTRAGAPGWTIITTNLAGGAFAARYAKADEGIWQRIADRFRQRAVWFDIASGSLRTR